MPELKICAALTATEGAYLELASQLELDRGCAVIGTVWTKGDMIDYLSNPNNKIFSWTDERSPIAFEDGKPYIPCKYKVLAGISYEISRDDNGRPIYDGKHIDHLVVDDTEGLEKSYNNIFEVLNILTNVWNDDSSIRRVTCEVDSRDFRWQDLLKAAGFVELGRKEVDGYELISMQNQ